MPSSVLRCCPSPSDDDAAGAVPLTYVDSTGTFWNVFLNGFMNILAYNYVDSDGIVYTVSDIKGKCVHVEADSRGFGKFYEPIECPCCPDDKLYITKYDKGALGYNMVGEGVCVTTSAPYSYTSPIPCITCVCPEPIEEPVCLPCTNKPLHQSFSFSVYKKYCACSDVVGEPKPLDQGSSFMPIQLQDPIVILTASTNFILKS